MWVFFQAGTTALMVASHSGHYDCVKELIMQGADINYQREVTSFHQLLSALFRCVNIWNRPEPKQARPSLLGESFVMLLWLLKSLSEHCVCEVFWKLSHSVVCVRAIKGCAEQKGCSHRRISPFLSSFPDRFYCFVLLLPAGPSWCGKAPVRIRCLHWIPDKGMRQWRRSQPLKCWVCCGALWCYLLLNVWRQQPVMKLTASSSDLCVLSERLCLPSCDRTAAPLSLWPVSVDTLKSWTCCWGMEPMCTTSWMWEPAVSPLSVSIPSG